MAGQAVDVGTGAVLTCWTTGFTGSVHLESIRWDNIARAAAPTSHLSTPAPGIGRRGNATFIPTRTVDPGEIIMAIQHNPQVRPPLHAAPELITLTFPKAPNDARPAAWSCMGFFVAVRDIVVPTDDKMLSAVVLKMTAAIQMTAAVGIAEESAVDEPDDVVCTLVPLALQTNLAVCLDLGEENGIRFDTMGTTDMNSFNGVTSVLGLGGRAAHFDASLFQSLSALSTDTTFNGGNWTWHFWARPGALPVGNQALLTQGRNVNAGQFEWFIELLPTGSLWVNWNGAGVIPSSTETLVPGAWNSVAVWHDGVDLFLQINQGLIETSAGAVWIVEGGLAFQIGAIGQENDADHAANNDFFTGDIQSVQLWRERVLTLEERAEIWNNGQGVRCVCP